MAKRVWSDDNGVFPLSIGGGGGGKQNKIDNGQINCSAYLGCNFKLCGCL